VQSKLTYKISAIAVATAALMAAGSAMAVENLYGGGATFPVPAYVGPAYSATTPDARLSTNAGNNAGLGFQTAILSANSIFADYSADYAVQDYNLSYCQTGSGTGKTTLIGANANQACRDYSTTPLGFSGAAVKADFIGTDSPISGADYTSYKAGPNFAAGKGITQIPTLAGAISLPYNDAVSAVAPRFNLTTEQVCKIYAGVIVDWNGIPATGAPAGSPITIVYRTDNSGTTFALTSWLASRCNNQFGIALNFFTPNQTFTAAMTGGLGIYASTLGASGNPGVVTAVGAAVGPTKAMGYADYAEVDTQDNTNANLNFATVNNLSPATFGTAGPVALAASSLKRAQVLNGSTFVAITDPAIPVGVRNCLFTVDPAVVIAGRYPIAAITYLNGHNSGNGTKVDAIKKLYQHFYTAARLPTANLPAGYAYVDGTAAGFGNVIRDALAPAGGEPGCVF